MLVFIVDPCLRSLSRVAVGRGRVHNSKVLNQSKTCDSIQFAVEGTM